MPRAAVQSSYGSPADVLRVVELPAEQPADDEVVVRMEAAAMHIADLRTIQGVEPFRFPVPRTPGFEGIGHVLRVGSAVRHLKVGDRVFPALASGIQLSLLTVNGPTAEVLLEDFADLQRGDWLIQNAANSSCGRYLIRLARLKGVRTVNVVRRAEMVDELRELGGDVVLVDGPDLAARAREVVQGAPIKLGIDAVAGPATQRIAECLAPGSIVASYGSMTSQRCELDFYLMFRQDIRLVGVSFARQFATRRTPEGVRAMYARLADLMSRGELVAKIAGVYPLERILEACDRAACTGSDRDGKVVIAF
jgi:NADPH:quinone reductase-like Zn-dependent oxidoreductase